MLTVPSMFSLLSLQLDEGWFQTSCVWEGAELLTPVVMMVERSVLDDSFVPGSAVLVAWPLFSVRMSWPEGPAEVLVHVGTFSLHLESHK